MILSTANEKKKQCVCAEKSKDIKSPFYIHVIRMPPNRLTNRLFSFWRNKEIPTKWLTEEDTEK